MKAIVLLIPGSKAWKSSNQASWDWFWQLWSHGRKVIKSSLLGRVLSTSGAMAGKSSNRASWDWFCRLLEPWPESHQIEPLGIGFVDFLSQCWKVIKSSLLGFVLSHRFTIPAQYYIRKYFVIGSLFIGSPVCGSSAYSPSRRGTHEKCVSMQKCFHNNLSAAAFTSHTLLLPAESALHEV